MFIRMVNNEWFTGKHYIYNKDQDKNRKEIKRLIESSEFVDDTDYDDDGYSTIPTNVRYKQFVDRTRRDFYSSNAKNRRQDRQIEISDTSLVFNENDRFRLTNQKDEDTPFKITTIDYNRNTHKTMATHLLPGLFDEYNSSTILTLQ